MTYYVSTDPGHHPGYPVVGFIAREGGITTDPAAAYYWNGFANPIFDRETTKRICDEWTAVLADSAAHGYASDDERWSFDDADGSVTIDSTGLYPEDDPADLVTRFEAPADGLYACFTMGYTWSIVEAPEVEA